MKENLLNRTQTEKNNNNLKPGNKIKYLTGSKVKIETDSWGIPYMNLGKFREILKTDKSL